MNINKTEIPPQTRWIMRRTDLHPMRVATKLKIMPDGNAPFEITLKNRLLQVVMTLTQTPLYCASPVRLSDIVHIAKRDHGLNIETLYFNDPLDPTASAFGVYVLHDAVRVLPKNELAT